MGWLKLLRRLRVSENGATIVEFAIVSSVFFMLLLGIIEYGLILMTKVAIESVAQEVSRSSSVNPVYPGCGGNRLCLVKALMADKTLGLVNPSYVQVTSTVVSSPTSASPPIPDQCVDTVGVPYPPTCSQFLDNNGIPGYQQGQAVTSGDVGVAGDLVEIRISYNWQIMFPMLKPFFHNGAVIMSSTTVVKNEPS